MIQVAFNVRLLPSDLNQLYYILVRLLFCNLLLKFYTHVHSFFYQRFIMLLFDELVGRLEK